MFCGSGTRSVLLDSNGRHGGAEGYQEIKPLYPLERQESFLVSQQKSEEHDKDQPEAGIFKSRQTIQLEMHKTRCF